MLDGSPGQHTVLDDLGPGPLGPTFRARDTDTGRTVLVEDVAELVGGDPLVRSRFLTDARAAAAVSHPNVVRLFEVGEEGPRLSLVFEHVEGRRLDEASGPMDARRVVGLGIQLAEALGAAHAQGLVHLDVSPAHVTLNTRGHAKLAGVGLSAWRRRAASRGRAVDAGAERYRAPEQRREDAGDHRSDLFSLGLLLHALLTGQPPAAEASDVRPREVNGDVPAELDAIVHHATAAAPAARYQSALALAAELRSVGAVLDVRSGDREPPTMVTATARPAERSPGPLIPLAGILIALAAGLWWWFGWS